MRWWRYGPIRDKVGCTSYVLPYISTKLWDRMSLNMGGDDITEFLYALLERINFPYRDIDLRRSYDWNIMEDLKSRLCTLAEVGFPNPYFRQWPKPFQGDVALNLYDFVVRRPDRPTEKYGLRAYDEIILAPMVLPVSKSVILCFNCLTVSVRTSYNRFRSKTIRLPPTLQIRLHRRNNRASGWSCCTYKRSLTLRSQYDV
jgi:hypothetical protein